MEITKETSYIIGLAQSDGHLSLSTRNRGRFTIELSDVDKDIIYKIAQYIPYEYSIFRRKRKTNFAKKFSGIGIRVCNQEFRKWLNRSGVPYGKKSLIVSPPLYLKGLSVDDYVRGLWDGDGSVGYTATKIPYLSFTTCSYNIKDFIENYIAQIIGNHKHHFTKPKRDSVFNIMVTKESAVLLAKKLYPVAASNMSIKRKFINAQKVKQWQRPCNMREITWKRSKWTKEEDEYLLTNGVNSTMKHFDRTSKSVIIRLWRLSLPVNHRR